MVKDFLISSLFFLNNNKKTFYKKKVIFNSLFADSIISTVFKMLIPQKNGNYYKYVIIK